MPYRPRPPVAFLAQEAFAAENRFSLPPPGTCRTPQFVLQVAHRRCRTGRVAGPTLAEHLSVAILAQSHYVVDLGTTFREPRRSRRRWLRPRPRTSSCTSKRSQPMEACTTLLMASGIVAYALLLRRSRTGAVRTIFGMCKNIRKASFAPYMPFKTCMRPGRPILRPASRQAISWAVWPGLAGNRPTARRAPSMGFGTKSNRKSAQKYPARLPSSTQ